MYIQKSYNEGFRKLLDMHNIMEVRNKYLLISGIVNCMYVIENIYILHMYIYKYILYVFITYIPKIHPDIPMTDIPKSSNTKFTG